MSDSPAQKAREAARSVEAAGLLPEADILYRLAETLEGQDRAAAAASLARILLAAGHVDQARPFALDGDDPVLVARLRLEAHDFGEARRLLDDARTRDPFDPRIASACGRLAFLEKRFTEAVESLLEAALLRGDGLPDSADRRFLRAARALAPGEIPPWKDAVAAARERLSAEASRRAPSAPWPDHSGALLRSLIRRGEAGKDGILDRARRLAEMPALEGLDESALFAAASAGELRRLASGSVLYRAGEPSREMSLIVQGGLELVRETPVGEQPMGEAAAGDLVGEEALLGATRCTDARAKGPATLLGFAPDFFAAEPERAGWLRFLRARLARRLARRNDLFKQFFPDAPGGSARAVGTRRAAEPLRRALARGPVALARDRRPVRRATASCSPSSPRRSTAPSARSSSARATPGTRSTSSRGTRPHLAPDLRRRGGVRDPRTRRDLRRDGAARPGLGPLRGRARATRRPSCSSSRASGSTRSRRRTPRAAPSCRRCCAGSPRAGASRRRTAWRRGG
jgi:CRP-like cAMP-binding protein